MTIELTSADVPQEDDLAKVRLVLEGIAAGLWNTQDLADKSGVSRRHVGYGINAAIVLGWVVEGEEKLEVTPAGQALLAQAKGTPEERAELKKGVEASPALKEIAPDLLGEAAPTRVQLGERICAATGLSKSTGERRAQALLAWRRQVLAK
jgi:hypothetical protein